MVFYYWSKIFKNNDLEDYVYYQCSKLNYNYGISVIRLYRYIYFVYIEFYVSSNLSSNVKIGQLTNFSLPHTSSKISINMINQISPLQSFNIEINNTGEINLFIRTQITNLSWYFGSVAICIK